MYLSSHYSKVNFRRFYESCHATARDKTGAIIQITETIERDEKLGCIKSRRQIIVDENGNARRKITRENGKLVLDELFGVYEKKYQDGKLIRHIQFKPNSLICKQGLTIDRTETLFSEPVKLLSWYSSGSLYKQIAYYKNNRKAYQFSKGSKKPLNLYRKTGELWAIFSGSPIQWSPTGSIFNGNRGYWHDKKQVKTAPEDISGSGSYSYRVFNKKGAETHAGQYEKNQKIGIWKRDGKEIEFYLSGVKVSEKIYKELPEKWKADEVLNIENAQLRASLLKKFTYERLIQQKQGKIIDTDTTAGRDNSIIEFINEKATGADKIIHILKVKCPTTATFYALRIPPELTNCEKARSWTFGANIDEKTRDITPENIIAFEKET